MKLSFRLFIVLIASCMLLSCASTNILEAEYDIQETIDGPDVADIIVVPTFSQDNMHVQAAIDFTTNKGTYCYDILITNNTDEVMYVNWEKSAIYYNGISSYIMINNQQFTDMNSPMPPMMVPPNGTATRSIISSDQPHYQPQVMFGPDWLIRVIPSFNTQLILCIESSQGETFYIYDVSGREVATE